MASSFDVMLERSVNATKSNECKRRLQALYDYIPMENWDKLVKEYTDAEDWFDIEGNPT